MSNFICYPWRFWGETLSLTSFQVKLSEVAEAVLQMDPDGLFVIPETFVQKPFTSKRGKGPTRQTVSWEMMQSVDPTLEARVWELAQSYGYSR